MKFKACQVFVCSSTAQYEKEHLDKFGCEPNGGFIKGGDDDDDKDCIPPPECNLFETKCCEDDEPKHGGPLLVTEPPPCEDGPDCLLFGDGCCKDNLVEPEPPCVPNFENCEIFGEDCCPGAVPSQCNAEEELFGNCGTEPQEPEPTTVRPDRRHRVTGGSRGQPTCGKRNPAGVDAVPVCSLPTPYLSKAVDDFLIPTNSGETESWGSQVWRVASCLCNPQKGVHWGGSYSVFCLLYS